MLSETILDSVVRHKKKLLIILLLGCLLLAGYAIYVSITRAGKIAVDVHIVPSSAEIQVDGKKLSFHTGTIYLTPGTHAIAVEKVGFAPYNQNMTFDSDRTLIVTSLTPQSDEAKKWAADHQDDYVNNEQYASLKAAQDGNYFFKKNPLAQKLPVKDPYYTIGYQTKDDGSMEVTVNTPSPRYRFFAVKRIRSLGYDPSDYAIVFTDYHNPLSNPLTEEK